MKCGNSYPMVESPLEMNGGINSGNAVRPAQPVAGDAASAMAITGRGPEGLLHGNEIVILLVRPSIWYPLAGSLRFSAVVVLLAVWLGPRAMASHWLQFQTLITLPAILITVRVAYAIMDWLSHWYMLTNCRIITIKGVRQPVFFQASLSKLSDVQLIRTPLERFLGLGSIGFSTDSHINPDSLWHWIARPDRVHQRIVRTMQDRRK